MLDGFMILDRCNDEVFVCDADKLGPAQFAYSKVQRKKPIGFIVIPLGELYRRLTDLIGPQLAAPTFPIEEAAKAAGIHYTNAHKWVQSGMLKASAGGRRGRGVPLRFSWWDLYIAGVLGSLGRAGCSVELQAKAAKILYQGSKAFGPKKQKKEEKPEEARV